MASNASDLASFPFARPSGTDPPTEYAKLRQQCPISKARLFDRDVWLVTKMKDLKEVLVDNRFSKVRTHPGFPELVPGAKAAIEEREPTFVDMDPPDHTRFRSMFEGAFTREAVDSLRPFIESTVDKLISSMEETRASSPGQQQGVDLNENFSLPLAFSVIYEIMGIPPEDGKMLSSNVAVRASGSSTARDAASAQKQIFDYMTKHVMELEASPSKGSRRDLINRVVEEQLRPGHITREQLAAHAFLLLVAGNATVASMINLGVVTLLQHSDQLAALKADPSLVPGAVEEICRYHTASGFALRRVALEQVDLSGATVMAGEGLVALNQSANRDEEVFPDPDRFDILRPPTPNVAYGYGPHECIARYLSLVELQCAFKGLFEKLPGLRLAVPFDQLQYTDPRRDVGLAKVPVTW